MFKRMLTISLFFVLFFGNNVFTQSNGSLDISPKLEPVNQNNTVTEAIWDVEFNYDATVVTLAAGNTGAVYIPSLGKFWTSRWATGVFHQWNTDGTLDMEFTLPFTGTRNMCTDGTFIYHCTSTTTVQVVDPATRTVVGTVPVVGAPNGFRSMTFNPDGDGGNGSLIGGNWTAPNLNFYEFSLTGTLLRTITSTVTGVYGIAYDNWSTGGPFLWVWGQGLGAGTPQIIQQMDYTTGLYTGIQHDVKTDVGIAQPTTGIAGGMFITDQLISGEVTMGGVLQGTPDRFFGYELAQASNPNIFFDDFDSYTAGVRLCTQTTQWQPWSVTPGTAEDPFVSDAFSWSPSNSVKIVQNNDLIRLHGSKTTGKWYMSFAFYIPATKTGYFNTMNGFAPNPNVWGMDVYFDAGGAGRIDTTGGGGGGANDVAFSWVVGQWNQAIIIIDLDTHLAEFWITTTPPSIIQVATWDWTQGGTKVNRLDCNDFYGAAATDEMYIDDYFFGDAMPVVLPVELSAFSANVNKRNVVLNWTTETEINNQGFEIERRSTDGQFLTIGHVNGNGTTTERKEYSYIDADLQTGTYYYRLKQVDFNGSFEYSNVVFAEITTPIEFALNQNYPNPFNPSTSISFSLAEPSFVKLAVYNLLGEEVQVLKNENMDAGSFNVNFDAASFPSGMYLYKIETAQFTSVRKMMLMK